MSLFKNASNIQIRLTRNDNPDNDDRIVIRYKDEDTYQIFFQDGNDSLESARTYCTVLSGAELDIYIESLFTLLSRDTDPFRDINFMIPCFPVVQYSPQDLRKGKIRGALKRVMPILYAAARY
jgi:hypothetical protein